MKQAESEKFELKILDDGVRLARRKDYKHPLTNEERKQVKKLLDLLQQDTEGTA